LTLLFLFQEVDYISLSFQPGLDLWPALTNRTQQKWHFWSSALRGLVFSTFVLLKCCLKTIITRSQSSSIPGA
jgi:hypothetical protein